MLLRLSWSIFAWRIPPPEAPFGHTASVNSPSPDISMDCHKHPPWNIHRATIRFHPSGMGIRDISSRGVNKRTIVRKTLVKLSWSWRVYCNVIWTALDAPHSRTNRNIRKWDTVFHIPWLLYSTWFRQYRACPIFPHQSRQHATFSWSTTITESVAGWEDVNLRTYIVPIRFMSKGHCWNKTFRWLDSTLEVGRSWGASPSGKRIEHGI